MTAAAIGLLDRFAALPVLSRTIIALAVAYMIAFAVWELLLWIRLRRASVRGRALLSQLTADAGRGHLFVLIVSAKDPTRWKLLCLWCGRHRDVDAAERRAIERFQAGATNHEIAIDFSTPSSAPIHLHRDN